MNNLFTKLRDFVGLNEPVEYEYDYDDDGDTYQNAYQQEPQPQAPPEEERPNRRRVRERSVVGSEAGMGSSSMNNVIGMPGAVNGISEVAVIEPRSFEEMPQVIQALRERKSVVLNLTIMDPDQAQRAVDFVAGGTYAIDGHQERIGESIFLFTPSCVQVSTQSGVVHEVATPQPRTSRPAAPAPAWASEPDRMAQ
ncbi:MAG TPA: cell division protein SepF [Cyanobacteria bacterium UBA12227]|nr:cell division protein SepF [Cyanobacteria bacterium UBA12227]HAX85056.1 cell division protein SepF [Cyanobacteria bacterium UBA11370]HBY80581.1 cell division protein SepF [Cyanobacteria bacterium UBA11148]